VVASGDRYDGDLLRIRPADPSEIDRLAELWHQGWTDAHATIVPPELTRLRTLESFRKRLPALLPQTRAVGEPGEPVGLAIIKGDELYQLYVSAQARGTGIAAALVADAEARLIADGVEIAWLACAIGNHRAARFYEKSGWHLARTFLSPLDTGAGIFPLEVWRYEKTLRRVV
jgi:GNAT superfamily N-acetyltransferase